MSAPDFWQQADAQKRAKEYNLFKEKIKVWQDIKKKIDENYDMLKLAIEEEDDSIVNDLGKNYLEIEKEYGELRTLLLFNGEQDNRNAYLTIHSGAGGTESCDWVSMLFRMYTRWAERKKFNYSVVDFQPGEEVGIRSVTLLIKGEFAYGLLKAEVGIHRLVRISPFDSNKRRHTSFASVDVIPEVEDNIEIEINENDLKIDTYRSSGAGGQHVNVTESAVRITHLPTGIIVQCQNERSQHQNKASALKFLKARLYEYYKEQQEKERTDRERGKKKIEWGSQIRSYVFQPYVMVKDHRTEVETGNGNAVMDGDIDRFIYAYLEKVSKIE